MEYMIVNGELYHHGTKGMRWGIRRYQNKDGSLTPAGRKRYSEELERYEAKAEEYRKKLGTSKSGKTEAEESLEQKKKKILDTHDAKQIYKNKDLFSDKEILDAYNRLNNERNIKNLIPEEKSKAQQIIDRYAKTSKTVKSVVDSSDDLYKSYVKGEALVKAILEKTGKVKHSDIEDYFLQHSDERKDHKYIKRVPLKNPTKKRKWRYIYELPKGEKEEVGKDGEPGKLGQLLDNVKDLIGVDEKEARDEAKKDKTAADKKLDTLKKEVYDYVNKPSRDTIDPYEVRTDPNVYSYVASKAAEAGRKYIDAEKAFDKTFLGKLENVKEAVEFGAKQTQKYLNDVVNKTKKEAEEKARKEAEEKARKEAEEKERAETEKAINNYLKQAEEFKYSEPPKSFDDLQKLSHDMSDDEDQAIINLYLDTVTLRDMDEYTTNCSYCTAAYELRQRGYDVIAAPRLASHDDTYTSELLSWYKDPELRSYNDIMNDNLTFREKSKMMITRDEPTEEQIITCFKQDIIANGEGSRGNINVVWASGGAHSMVWEVKNGEVIIRDCQINRTYDFETVYEYTNGYGIEYYRTDNLELDDDILNIVRNRDGREDLDPIYDDYYYDNYRSRLKYVIPD